MTLPERQVNFNNKSKQDKPSARAAACNYFCQVICQMFCFVFNVVNELVVWLIKNCEK